MAIGDIALYRHTSKSGTTAAWTDVYWTQTDREDAIYSLQANKSQVEIGETGYYLAIYNIRARENGRDNRTNFVSRLEYPAGTLLEDSFSSAYSRHDENDELYAVGHSIIKATSTTDLLNLEWYAHQGGGFISSQNDETSLMLVKLSDATFPDGMDVGRYSDATDNGDYWDLPWTNVPWDTIEEESDTSVIEFKTPSGVTLKDNGRYLVGYTITFINPGARAQLISRASLNDVPIENSYSYCYLRNSSSDPQSLMAMFMVSAESNDLLKVAINSGNYARNDNIDITRRVNESGLWVLKLPSTTETIISHDSNGGETADATTTLDIAETVDQIDSASFSVVDEETIQIEQDGDYIFMGNFLTNDTTGGGRAQWEANFYVDGSKINHGIHGCFKRGPQGGENCFNGCANPAAIISSLSTNNQIQLRTALAGQAGGTNATTPDGIGIAAIRIGSLIPATAVSTHSFFSTPVGSATAWIWNSGQFNSDSGLRATSDTPTDWIWAKISSSSTFFYPSGSPTAWTWVSGNYQGGGM